MNSKDASTSASTNPPQRRKRILLGITGSVAAIKGPEIALLLSRELDAHVVVLLTHGGSNFWYKAKDYNPQIWEEYENFQRDSSNRGDDDDGDGSSGPLSLPGMKSDSDARSIVLFTADDEWKGWQRMKDPVLHIQLRDWADMAVIAPLSAHTLAKIANGLCDETLSCVLRAWDFGYSTVSSNSNSLGCQEGKEVTKPIVLAPAMNTAMWEHPLTKSQLTTIEKFGKNIVKIVSPQVKTLACGEVGNGALANPKDIVQVAKDAISQ